jgi:hypothetical protein
LRYYHTTDAADSILSEEFRDNSGSHGLSSTTLTGVFISDPPLDGDEHVNGNKVLQVDLPADLGIADYQLIEEGKPYHQWCLPASLLSGCSCRLLTKEQLDSIGTRFY